MTTTDTRKMADSTPSAYTCSLTGLPATNPVVTPSGHICSKSLLLTKLSENGGIDPFDPANKRIQRCSTNKYSRQWQLRIHDNPILLSKRAILDLAHLK